MFTDRLGPPTKPIISGYVAERQLSVGDVLELGCTAGLPSDAVVWYRVAVFQERRLSSNCTTTTTGAGNDVVSTCRLTIVVQPEDNAAVYKCTATYSTASLMSSIRLTVLCELFLW